MENINIIWGFGKENENIFGKAAKVRKVVFCDEQGYSIEQELDDIDEGAYHVLLEIEGEPAATGRMFYNSKEDEKLREITLGRIAVHSHFRGLDLGRKIMAEMAQKAMELSAVKLKLSAQCRVSGFYEKCGFIPLGETYMDGHVLHQMMEKLI